MNRPEISIIIPFYNVAEYLPQCLDSVLNQTMDNIELVLVDDRGTDDSAAIAERYAQKDARIKLVRHKTNQGIAVARNSGLEHSTAPYIMFVDSDDYVERDFCEKLYHAIVSSQADLAMCATRLFGDRHKKIKSLKEYLRYRFPTETELTEEVIENTNCCLWNKIYRKSIIEANQMRFPAGLKHEDEYWWRLYALHSKRMVYIEDVLYHYRQRTRSIMSDVRVKRSINQDMMKSAIALYRELKKNGIDEHRRFAIEFFLRAVVTTIVRNRSKESRECILDTATAFIQDEHITEFDCSLSGQRLLKLIMARTVATNRKYLGGLIIIKEKKLDRDIKFLGITVWRDRYDKTCVVGNLFGMIPVKIRKQEKREP